MTVHIVLSGCTSVPVPATFHLEIERKSLSLVQMVLFSSLVIFHNIDLINQKVALKM